MEYPIPKECQVCGHKHFRIENALSMRPSGKVHESEDWFCKLCGNLVYGRTGPIKEDA